MDYMITNQAKKVYIRLNSNGSPETCVKTAAQKFTDVKAKNILKHLPKTLQHFHFMVVPSFENENKETNETSTKVKSDVSTTSSASVIKNEDYVVPDTVNSWVDRIEKYNSLVSDAKKRKDELINLQSNADRELSNCLHAIEMTKWKNGCDGYKEYKKMKTLLEKRRSIKDELAIVQSISTYDTEGISVDHVVKKLKNRDFTLREVEDYDFLFN